MIVLELNTKYAFGKDAVNYLSEYIKQNKYKKALIVYGGGSIKKNGLYDTIIKNLEEIGCKYLEKGGISANPLASEVFEIARSNREEDIDVIIAAGGGSVIDSSKAIAALIANKELKSVEELMDKAFNLTKNIPIIAIPTTASTASENNNGSVITLDHVTPHQKTGVYIPCEVPALALEDSAYLASASDWQIAAGIYDTFCHNIEQYFADNTFAWTKEYLFGNMRNILKYGPIFLNDKNNVEARDNVMWTSTMSLNPLSRFNTQGYWMIHFIEHGVSGVWNVTHGAGNALITPAYIKYASENFDDFKQKALVLAKEVFKVNSVDELIEAIVDWITLLKLPTKWTDFQEIKTIPSDAMIDELVKHIQANRIARYFPSRFNNYDFIYHVLKLIK